MIALFGVWLFGEIIAPFILGVRNVQAGVWNHIIVGSILVITGVWAALTRNVSTSKTVDWIAAVAGGWLMIARFMLGMPEIAAALWNDIIVGGFVLLLGVWTALSAPRGAG